MGTDALLTSGVTEKMLYLIRDPRARSPTDPLNKVRKSRIVIFTLVELIGFGATFAITQTIAAIGFPVIIMLLVPLRVWIVPHLGFTDEELGILDGAVASPFVSSPKRENKNKRTRKKCSFIMSESEELTTFADNGVGRRVDLEQTIDGVVLREQE